ncbi:unnamed protein product, partial [Rotaria sp. Silwood1]
MKRMRLLEIRAEFKIPENSPINFKYIANFTAVLSEFRKVV